MEWGVAQQHQLSEAVVSNTYQAEIESVEKGTRECRFRYSPQSVNPMERRHLILTTSLGGRSGRELFWP